MWTLGSRREDVAVLHGYNDGAFPESAPVMTGLKFYVGDNTSYIKYTQGFMAGLWHRHLRLLRGYEEPFGLERLLYSGIRKRSWYAE